jgi:hypothetical protein
VTRELVVIERLLPATELELDTTFEDTTEAELVVSSVVLISGVLSELVLIDCLDVVV